MAWKGLSIVLVGLTIGLCGSAALRRWLGSLLFGVGPLDPAVLAGISLTLVTAAAVACWLPASRTVEVDPVIALRHE